VTRAWIVLTSSRRFSPAGIEVADSVADARLTTSSKATKRLLNAWKMG
jgi:hypothetical protein